MYRFAVETALGRTCWAFGDRHADTVRSFIRGLRRARIIPAHLEHFALHHTEDHAMRQLVANTWKTHRQFWPSRRGTAKAWGQLPQRDVHVHAVFGDRDAIIPWAWSRPWRLGQQPRALSPGRVGTRHAPPRHGRGASTALSWAPLDETLKTPPLGLIRWSRMPLPANVVWPCSWIQKTPPRARQWVQLIGHLQRATPRMSLWAEAS